MFFYTILLTTTVCFGDNSNGMAPFIDINPYKTPIVTNAEEAINYVMSPIGIEMKIDEDNFTDSSMICRPNRMNVVTNDVYDIMDIDIKCKFNNDYRTGKIYFGPEYRQLITSTLYKGIRVVPDGVLFNNSTNMIVITQVPAILSLTQFLGSNLWVTVDYPQFEYRKITLDSITVDSNGVISIFGKNLDSVKYQTSDANVKKLQYIVDGSVETNDVVFTYNKDTESIQNSTLSKTSSWLSGKKHTFLITTADRAFDVKYETLEISYPTTLVSAKPFVIKEDSINEVKKDEEEVGFFETIWDFFKNIF